MKLLIKLILINFISFLFFSANLSFSQDQDVGEILENIQKDLRTLERAVYSQSFSENSDTNYKSKSINKRSRTSFNKTFVEIKRN